MFYFCSEQQRLGGPDRPASGPRSASMTTRPPPTSRRNASIGPSATATASARRRNTANISAATPRPSAPGRRKRRGTRRRGGSGWRETRRGSASAVVAVQRRDSVSRKLPCIHFRGFACRLAFDGRRRWHFLLLFRRRRFIFPLTDQRQGMAWERDLTSPTSISSAI